MWWKSGAHSVRVGSVIEPVLMVLSMVLSLVMFWYSLGAVSVQFRYS